VVANTEGTHTVGSRTTAACSTETRSHPDCDTGTNTAKSRSTDTGCISTRAGCPCPETGNPSYPGTNNRNNSIMVADSDGTRSVSSRDAGFSYIEARTCTSATESRDSITSCIGTGSNGYAYTSADRNTVGTCTRSGSNADADARTGPTCDTAGT